VMDVFVVRLGSAAGVRSSIETTAERELNDGRA